MSTLAIAYGRLSPPHKGHLQLAQTLAEQDADEHYLYLSHSYDPKKNPLPYDTKIEIVRKLFKPLVPITVVESDARNPLEALEENSGRFDNIIFIAGSDRLEHYKGLFEKYNGVPVSGNILYSYDSITVVNAGERDPDSSDVSGMSASKMRLYALRNDFDNFFKGLPTADESFAKYVFEEVRKNMRLEESRSLYHLYEEDGRELSIEEIASKLFTTEQQQKDFISSYNNTSQTMAPEEFAQRYGPEVESTLEELDRKIQQDENRAGQAEVNKAKVLSAHGNIEAMGIPKDQLHAQVVLTLADPITRTHYGTILNQLNKAPREQGNKQLVNVIAVLSSAAGTIAPLEVRANWVYEFLIKPKSPRTAIIFGTPENLANILANVCSSVTLFGQESIINKAKNLFQVNWTNAGNENAAIAAHRFSQTIDIPNAAQEALQNFDTQKTQGDFSEELSKTKGELKDQTQAKIELLKNKRMQAFIQALPETVPVERGKVIYHAYQGYYRKAKRHVKSALISGINTLLQPGPFAQALEQELGIKPLADLARKVAGEGIDAVRGEGEASPQAGEGTTPTT